jgi:mannose-6-phosphate isomerase-like protein (cupin superfamily)
MNATTELPFNGAGELRIAGGNCTPLVVDKPWGCETTLAVTPGFTVRRVEMKPFECLSQQGHLFKDEVYVVLAGSGRVELGADRDVVVEIDARSTPLYLPAGTLHKTFSDGGGLLILEVSTSYATDAVRVQDQYGRGTMAPEDFQRFFRVFARAR